jgi:dienelactone hydrolase
LSGPIRQYKLIKEVAMMRLRVAGFTLSSLLLTAACLAQQSSSARVVDLTAADGTPLKATFFASAKPGPGVLLLHQCNRQRKVWDELGRQLSSAGVNVLTLDLRGFGESGGTPVDQVPPDEARKQAEKWPDDIDTALAYLEAQAGVNREVIGVGGASCGVNNSVQAARRHPEIKSMALLSGNTDVEGRQFLRRAAQIPVLFAVADDDEFPASIDAIEWLYVLSPNSGKEFLHYKTGGHGADIFKVHPELRDRIVNWYVTTLIETPGKSHPVKDKPRIPERIRILEVIDQPGGALKVEKTLAEARRKDPKAALFSEELVNLVGYEHLQSGDVQGAIAILQLNAAAYPQSPNVYDSLGDVYLADGQKELARQNAKKALALLAGDTADPEARRNAIRESAEQKLKQLGEGQP